jgi:hypothetical protein
MKLRSCGEAAVSGHIEKCGASIRVSLSQELGQEPISFEDSTGKPCRLEVVRFLNFSIAYYKLDFITISFFVRSRANTVVTCPVPRG